MTQKGSKGEVFIKCKVEEEEKVTKEMNNGLHGVSVDGCNMELLPLLTDEDIIRVSALAKEIWHEHYDSIIGALQVDYMTEKFQSPGAIREQIKKEGYQYYQLVGPDGPAGYFAYHAVPEGLFLSKIYIAKDYRGRGYSHKVMEHLEQFADEHRLSKIWLTVNRMNASSILAYEKLGFTKAGTQVSDIGCGFVMDDYIMEKPLFCNKILSN